MYDFSKPYCITNFYVFPEYKLSYFWDWNTLSTNGGMKRELEAPKPSAEHYDLYEEITNEETKELAGTLAYAFVSKASQEQFLKTGEASKYNPLEVEDLYLELNKIKLFDAQSLLKFIKEYGLPSYIMFWDDGSFHYHSVSTTDKAIFEMDIMLFYRNLIEFQKNVRIWDAIQNEARNELIKIKEDFEQKAKDEYADSKDSFALEYREVFLQKEQEEVLKNKSIDSVSDYQEFVKEVNKKVDYTSFKPPEIWTLWERVQNKPFTEIANHYLIHRLNNEQTGTPCFQMVDGKPAPAIKFDTLLDVANWQLSKAVTKGVVFERCLNCGALFEPIHGHQKFCPPLPGRKRSTCENTYNQRMKRKRRKEKMKKEG